VARIHRCESLVLGLSDLEGENTTVFLEKLMGRVDSDIVVLRAANGLNMSLIKRVLVPVGGHSGHDHLRARILGSLQYMGIDQISFLQILPETTPEKLITRRREWLKRMTEDERINNARIIVERSSRPIDEIIRHAADNDLLILGLQRLGRRHKMIGNVVRQIAEKTSCGLILISRRR
jgi:hypothetical protein